MKSTKFFLSSIILLMMLCVMSVSANADLVDNSDGTITDTDTNLMWLMDANYAQTSGYDPDGRMTWSDSMTWANSLIYAGYDDWRLPITDTTCSGTDTDNTGCTDSEMGHLFYTELGNVSYYTGCTIGVDCGLVNTGDFQNWESGISATYWSGTESNASHSWYFSYHDGTQFTAGKVNDFYAIAVRPGLAVVPEPISSALFIIGGATLGFRRFRKKIKNI